MNIREFKKGDKIVRTERSKSLDFKLNPITGQFQESGDRSYIGEQLTFVSIANGCIYFDLQPNSSTSIYLGSTRIDLPLDLFEYGWEYWQNPDKVKNTNKSIKLNLKKQLQEAIENEDYELISELKDILNDSVKNIQL